MAVRITNAHVLNYDDWLAVLDALEPDASEVVRERAQDVLNRHAPQPWLRAAEVREQGWQR